MNSFQRFMTRPPLTITISKTNIHFGKDVYDVLGRPRTVNLLFDADSKRLWIQPSEKGTNRVHLDRNNYRLSSVISKKLPCGWYQRMQLKKDVDGSIFKLFLAKDAAQLASEGKDE